ncbi:membrane protein [Planotetraspora thailandica]|uniref:Membrane protein n=1 Tax=Planotetraspora thailandica TaxID=487172 RepID=A0A8J3VBT4_9ACTN|nr:cytochrome c oxidase assembly protein [Planotetraspora thailandica]GII54180.1 membrane protein [Planotetraspora thailandica]
MHEGHAPGGELAGVLSWLAAFSALAAVVLYTWAAARSRRRGRGWPAVRQACFALGGVSLAVAAVSPLPGGEFTAHMLRHLLAGMAAPLLLVLGRPVTLALRVAGGAGRRRLLAVVRSRVVTWLLFPPLAALLDMGGLWALYRTPVFAATHHAPLLHALVHVHVVAAGVLFSASICQVEPLRRRYGLAVRAGTLVAASAAHAILAKSLYGTPPPGTAFPAGDVRAGAALMYYGGDLIEIGLAAVVAVQWYVASGRALSRARPPAPLVP